MGGVWSCPVDIPLGCPGPACPDPASIVQNGACTEPSDIVCETATPLVLCNGQNLYGNVECTCESGAWSCELGAPACPLDGGLPSADASSTEADGPTDG
jgi:hypothetical protein